MMTIKELVNFGQVELKNFSSTPFIDTSIILSHILNKEKTYLIAHSEDLINNNLIKKFKILIKNRKTKKPISYLLDNKEFYNLYYFVNQYTLIPRPETELLVENCLNIINKLESNHIKILEIGTGSGCIAISTLFNTQKNVYIDAIDISRKALNVAEFNAINLLTKKQRNRIHFLNKNIFKYIAKEKFDIIISNPPYITSNEFRNLDIGIKKFEPSSALLGGKDGLKFYRRIYDLLPTMLAMNGTCLLEINDSLKNETIDIFNTNYSTEIINDYAGLPRIIKIT